MTKIVIPAAKVAEALEQVEDLLMDDRAEGFALFTDDERGALRAFEAVATTVVENGGDKDVVLDYLVAEHIAAAFKASLEAFDRNVG